MHIHLRGNPMIRLRLERREDTPLYLQILIPIASVIVALVICSGLVWLSGADVVEAYRLLLLSTFESSYDIQDTLVKAAPLLLTGLAVARRLPRKVLEHRRRRAADGRRLRRLLHRPARVPARPFSWCR